jgi:hypothetical protein
MSASCWRDQACGLPESDRENDAAAEVFEQRQSEPKLCEPNSLQSGRRNAAARERALVKSRVPTTTASGTRPTMNVRHEPTERVLHNEKRHNHSVKYFRGGSIAYLFCHDVP